MKFLKALFYKVLPKQSVYAKAYQQQAKSHQYIAGLALIQFAEFSENERVLDLGSGTGELTREIAKAVAPSGQVIGIDPDGERVKVANAEKPSDLTNLSFQHHSIESFSPESGKKFDVIFSNQVLHWVDDKSCMLEKAEKLLVPNGRFVFQCVTGHPPVFHDVAVYSDTLKQILEKIDLSTESHWMDLLAHSDFRILKKGSMEDYCFTSLSELLLWLEATTHGAFQLNHLSKSSIATLRKKYPGKIYVFSDETLKLSLARKEK